MSLVTQHHGQARTAGLQLDQLVDDLVVVEVFRQPGQRLGTLAHKDRQVTAGPALIAHDRHPVLDLLRSGTAENLVDQANSLATLGRHPLFTAFQLVQLFQHRHRDGDVVLLKIQQGIRVVDQYVGIEGVQGWRGGADTSVIFHTRSPFHWGPDDAALQQHCAANRASSSHPGRWAGTHPRRPSRPW